MLQSAILGKSQASWYIQWGQIKGGAVSLNCSLGGALGDFPVIAFPVAPDVIVPVLQSHGTNSVIRLGVKLAEYAISVVDLFLYLVFL